MADIDNMSYEQWIGLCKSIDRNANYSAESFWRGCFEKGLSPEMAIKKAKKVGRIFSAVEMVLKYGLCVLGVVMILSASSYSVANERFVFGIIILAFGAGMAFGRNKKK